MCMWSSGNGAEALLNGGQQEVLVWPIEVNGAIELKGSTFDQEEEEEGEVATTSCRPESEGVRL